MDPLRTSFLAHYSLNTLCENEDAKGLTLQSVFKIVGFNEKLSQIRRKHSILRLRQLVKPFLQKH